MGYVGNKKPVDDQRVKCILGAGVEPELSFSARTVYSLFWLPKVACS